MHQPPIFSFLFWILGSARLFHPTHAWRVIAFGQHESYYTSDSTPVFQPSTSDSLGPCAFFFNGTQHLQLHADSANAHLGVLPRTLLARLPRRPNPQTAPVNRTVKDKKEECAPAYPTCALVGNSGSMLGARDGRSIDAHSIVMRMKLGPTADHHEDVGNRTDFRFQFIASPSWIAEEDSDRGAVTWFTRNGGHSLFSGRDWLETARRLPAGRVLVDGPDFEDYAAQLFHYERPDMQSSQSKRMKLPSRKGSASSPGRGAVLSTGARALAHALTLCGTVHLYGFSFFASQDAHERARGLAESETLRFYPAIPYHYWWIQRPPGPANPGSEAQHSFQREMQTIRRLIAAGRVHFHPGNLHTPDRIPDFRRPKVIDSRVEFCEFARRELMVLELPTVCLHFCLQLPSDPFCGRQFRGEESISELAVRRRQSGAIGPAPGTAVIYRSYRMIDPADL
jgi:hypothetical protein